MPFSAKEVIVKRQSVRSFDGETLKVEDKDAICQYIQNVPNPFGVKVEFRLLDAKEHDLSSSVVVGANQYIAAKVPKCKQLEIGCGYSFESVCLYVKSLGIGTVILAASLDRPAFEKAMDVQDNEIMAIASPVGYPAEKPALRDKLMRRVLLSDSRIPFEQLFFNNIYNESLDKERAGTFFNALEMLRWAPSATNKQPWRAVVVKDVVHFFEEKSIKDNALGDVQKIDMGIALSHFDLTMQEEGNTGYFFDEDPHFELPDKVKYIISYKLKQ